MRKSRVLIFILSLIVTLALCLTSLSSAEEDSTDFFLNPSANVKIDLSYPKGIVITRHPEIVATIDPNTSQVVDRESLRITINGEDYSRYLRQAIASDGSLTLIFKPAKPLPIGKLRITLSGVLLTGDKFQKTFYMRIDPSADPSIKPYFKRVMDNPNDYQAYYELGRIYERKYLLLDAYNYYKKAWELKPDFIKAKKSFQRIFAALSRKALRKDGIVIDVSLNDSILKWSRGIVLFDIIMENYNRDKDLKVVYSEIVLSDASGRYYKPVGDLLPYVREEAKKKRIPLEVFAKLNYYLETTPIEIMTSDVIVRPMSYKKVTVAFRIANPNTKLLTLTIAGLYIGGERIRMKFPFLR